MNPWDDEPDEFGGEMMCARRRPTGHWCGYVAIPPGHPWYGRHYDDIPVEVHGGLTYARHDSEHHFYWVGFDCAHVGDLIPFMAEKYGPMPGDVYRDLGYVKSEIIRLARQIAASAESPPQSPAE